MRTNQCCYPIRVNPKFFHPSTQGKPGHSVRCRVRNVSTQEGVSFLVDAKANAVANAPQKGFAVRVGRGGVLLRCLDAIRMQCNINGINVSIRQSKPRLSSGPADKRHRRGDCVEFLCGTLHKKISAQLFKVNFGPAANKIKEEMEWVS